MFGRRVARNLLWGGAVLNAEKTSNDLDPDFNRSWISLSRFLVQTEVVSKKKKFFFTQIQSVFLTNFRRDPKNNSSFVVQIRASPSQLLIANPIGGDYFQFWSKNRPQKHLKTWFLHTFHANGKGSSPPAPPGYATVYFKTEGENAAVVSGF